MKKTVLQKRLMDCGPACLLSIAHYHGFDPNINEIRKICGTNWTGTSMAGLEISAKSLGLKANAVWADTEAIKSLELPIIAHIKIWWFLSHYIVIYKVGKDFLEVMDPGLGIIKKMTMDNFKKKWTNALIIFQDMDLSV